MPPIKKPRSQVMPSRPESDDPAVQRAYDEGIRRASIDGQLSSHEERLNRINGSIDRHAKSVEDLRNDFTKKTDSIQDEVDKLGTSLGNKIDDISNKIMTSDAIEKDRNSQLTRANDQQVSKRMYYVGIGTLVFMMASLIVAVIAVAH